MPFRWACSSSHFSHPRVIARFTGKSSSRPMTWTCCTPNPSHDRSTALMLCGSWTPSSTTRTPASRRPATSRIRAGRRSSSERSGGRSSATGSRSDGLRLGMEAEDAQKTRSWIRGPIRADSYRTRSRPRRLPSVASAEEGPPRLLRRLFEEEGEYEDDLQVRNRNCRVVNLGLMRLTPDIFPRWSCGGPGFSSLRPRRPRPRPLSSARRVRDHTAPSRPA